MDEKYEAIKEIVKKELSCSAHDLDHVERVYNLAMLLAKDEEKVDLEVLLPAILLHDIARVHEDRDMSGKTDHAMLGGQMAGGILARLGFDAEKIKKIIHCIVSHRYRSTDEPESIEAKILFDADKLDVTGATGIARSFMLAGQFRERLYTAGPLAEYLRENVTENGRLKDPAKHSPNFEYEIKLKNIPEKLYTKKAEEIARERIAFMNLFFARLQEELKGEK